MQLRVPVRARGKVKLTDSTGAYLPTLPAAWRGVTIRQLQNHTSGIPSYTSVGPRWTRRWGEDGEGLRVLLPPGAGGE